MQTLQHSFAIIQPCYIRRGCYTVKCFVQLVSQCFGDIVAGQVARNISQDNIPCNGQNRCETSCKSRCAPKVELSHLRSKCIEHDIEVPKNALRAYPEPRGVLKILSVIDERKGTLFKCLVLLALDH